MADGFEGEIIMDGGFKCSICYPWFEDEAIHPRDKFPDYEWKEDDLLIDNDVPAAMPHSFVLGVYTWSRVDSE